MELLQPLYDTSFLIKAHLYLQIQSQFYKWENLALPFFSCEASLYKLKNDSHADSALAIFTIFPTYRPPIKKLLLQNVFHLFQGVQN